MRPARTRHELALSSAWVCLSTCQGTRSHVRLPQFSCAPEPALTHLLHPARQLRQLLNARGHHVHRPALLRSIAVLGRVLCKGTQVGRKREVQQGRLLPSVLPCHSIECVTHACVAMLAVQQYMRAAHLACKAGDAVRAVHAHHHLCPRARSKHGQDACATPHIQHRLQKSARMCKIVGWVHELVERQAQSISEQAPNTKFTLEKGMQARQALPCP